MAKYNDPPLKQIVDDLNIQNESTVPAPLTVEQCSIANPVGIPTVGELNTTATLTVVGDANYPSGSMTVRYRRLQGPILYGDKAKVDLPGAEEQVFTLRQILAKVEAGINAGLINELIPEIVADLDTPVTYSRSLSMATMITRNDSIKFITGPTLEVKTVKVDIGLFTAKVIPGYGYDSYADETVIPGANANPQQRLVDRFLAINSLPAELVPSDLVWGQATQNLSYVDQFQVPWTVRADHPTFFGSGTFQYTVMNLGAAINERTGSYYYEYTNDGSVTGSRGIQAPFFATNNLYYVEAEWEDAPLPLRRQQVNMVPPEYTSPLPVYSGTSRFDAWIRHTATALYPLESIVEATLQALTFRPAVFNYSNQANIPVTIEVLAAPPEYTGGSPMPLVQQSGTWAYNGTMPPGNYKFRATAADSYDVMPGQSFPETFTWGADVSMPEIKLTKIIKHKAYASYSVFGSYPGQTLLTEIAPDAFAEATYLVVASQMFKGCTGLTSIPNNLFANARRISRLSNMFEGCTGITSIPDYLFANFVADQGSGFTESMETGPFRGTSVTSVNNTIYFNSRRARLPSGLFAGMSLLTSVPANLLEGIGAVQDTGFWFTTLEALFKDSGLTAIPETILDDYLIKRKAANNTGVGLVSAFANTKITTIPAALLSKASTMIITTIGMFQDCALLNNVPEGLFTNVTLANGFQDGLNALFKGCTSLQSISKDVFGQHNNVKSLDGMFQGSGLTTIPADFTSKFQGITSVNEMFADCAALTIVPTGIFAQSTTLKSFRGTFARSGITTVPVQLLWASAGATTVESLFEGCASLTSLPGQLLQNSIALVNAKSLFKGSGVANGEWLGGFLAFNPLITSVSSIFENCANITSVPDSIFVPLVNCTDFTAAFKGSGVASIPATVFGANTKQVIITSMFENCAGLTAVGNDIFYPLAEVTSINRLFAGCPNLMSIGRLINKTQGTGFLNAGGMTTHNADIALADNLIISTNVCQILASDAVAGFRWLQNNTVLTKDITNLFGANMRPYIGFNFRDMKVTGSGNAFIAKHSLSSSSSSTGLFYNCTTLNDYGSLPSWATSSPGS